MLKFANLVFLTLIFFHKAALANDNAVMRGFGTSTCGEFAQQYKSSPDTANALYMTWAIGFMSGYNIGAVANKRPMKLLPDPDKIEQSIQTDCDQRPLAKFFDVVYQRLMKYPDSKVLTPSNR